MDASDYLRRVKMSMVNAVPSTNNIWLRASVRVEGPQGGVHIGDYGHVEFEDDTYSGPGHIGVYTYRKADLRGLRVSCISSIGASLWDTAPGQATNWKHPLPTADRVWQQPIELSRFDDGELLLQVNIQKVMTASDDAVALRHLMNSTDSGHTQTRTVMA